MDVSSHAPASLPGLIGEPPLSPGAPPPVSPPTASEPPEPGLEAQVVRVALMTPDEVDTTMREEAETGRPFQKLVVEHGHVQPEDLATLAGTGPATEQTIAARTFHATIYVRLTDGERVAVGTCDSEDAAERRTRELMDALDAGVEWPRHDGRHIRPDAVVSIDVDVEQT